MPPTAAQSDQPHLLVLGVRRFVIINLYKRNFNGALRHIIKESTVVRHQYHCPVIIYQEIFQPLNGFNIEVIGGFVEQHNTGFLQQYLCKLHAHLPTAAEF